MFALFTVCLARLFVLGLLRGWFAVFGFCGIVFEFGLVWVLV